MSHSNDTKTKKGNIELWPTEYIYSRIQTQFFLGLDHRRDAVPILGKVLTKQSDFLAARGRQTTQNHYTTPGVGYFHFLSVSLSATLQIADGQNR